MTERKVQLHRNPGGESIREAAEAIGPFKMKMGRLEVTFTDACGLTTNSLLLPGGEYKRVAIMMYDPDGIGLIHQMTPDYARTVAASLLKLANMLDPLEPN